MSWESSDEGPHMWMQRRLRGGSAAASNGGYRACRAAIKVQPVVQIASVDRSRDKRP